MNNPADTLAALADEIETAALAAPLVLGRAAIAISPALADDWTSRLRALASLKGEAVDPVDLARWLHQKLVGFSRKDYDSPRVVMDLRMVCGMLAPLYTTPPAPQADQDTDMMAECMIECREGLIATGIIEASVPPMFVAEAVIAKFRSLTRPTPSPAPQGGGEAVTWVVASPEGTIIAHHWTRDQAEDDLGSYGVCNYTVRPLIYGDTTPPPQQAGMSALNDGLERFKVQVEKRLCTILGKRWQPAGGGICIDNLCEEIAARLGGQQADERAQGGGERFAMESLPVNAPMQHPERNAAEQAYTQTAFNYEANPIGCRDWTIYWRGWWHRAVINDLATPPAQQPGEVGEADYKEAYSRMVAGAEKALYEIEDAGPKALKYAAQEIRAALQSADAALAPKEKGNG